MEEFLKMDIFFVVTTAAIVVLTLLLGIFVVYLIRIGNKVERFMDKAHRQLDLVSEDVADLRSTIRAGLSVKNIISYVSSIAKKRKPK